MDTININSNEFNAIKLEDCLNYIPYTNLEQSINRYVKQTLNILCKNEIIECDNNKKVEFILKQVLLRIATSNAWVNNQEKHKLNKHYLYIVIKKYIYQYVPELIQE